MMTALIELGLFSAKTFIIVFGILVVLIVFFALISRGKDKSKGKLTIKNLNKKYAQTADALLEKSLSKKQFKHYLKEKKTALKLEKKQEDEKKKNIYVLQFNGDIKASAVASLREEITAILTVATPQDEVVVNIESAGGMVHGYGLAAAQLMRVRAKNIPLTVTIDKVAASGGYLMACIANKILCAPFAIVGSIGVIVQLPNFHRLLKEKNIDFEQLTAGEYKRTLTMFGENTEAGREKLHQEIEDIHQHFKNLITTYRKQINIQQVATGEHWLGEHAITLNLVDVIQTSDDYLLENSQQANVNVFEVSYEIKKSFLSKFSAGAREAEIVGWIRRFLP